MATNNNPLYIKLDALYDKMQSLKSSSPPSEFFAFGGFFSEDCTVYLKSMRTHAEPALVDRPPSKPFKLTLAIHLNERRILSRAVSANGLISIAN
jgi:hypothetical protein